MTEDYHSADRFPLAGKLTPFSQKIHAASGFGGWGLTNATVAARIISDRILGRESEWDEAYNPARFKSLATSRFLQRNLHAGRHLISGMLARGEKRGVSAVEPGEGAILEAENGKAAVYRDAEGHIHAFSPYCPHMGCLLSWNGFDRTWDCSCHGSRFTAKGTMLHGPADRDMKPKEMP